LLADDYENFMMLSGIRRRSSIKTSVIIFGDVLAALARKQASKQQHSWQSNREFPFRKIEKFFVFL